MANAASPLQLQERNHLIDVLRGFAILGILMANLSGWITFALPKEQAAQLMTTTADKATEFFLSLFVENKFITLFCLLFGYGFGVIIERMTTKRIPVVSFFMRRMLVLLVLGLVHLGLWWGEILSTYALCGMLLLLFRKVSDRGLLIWGVVLLFLIGPLLQALKLYFYVEDSAAIAQLYTQYLASIRSSDLLRIFEFNYKMVDAIFIRDWSQFRDMAEVLGKFLFGYFVLRKKILSDPYRSGALFKKILLFVLPVGLLYLAEKTIVHILHVEVSVPFRIMLYWFDRAGILSLSLVYAIVIALLFSHGRLKTLTMIFRPVGMMSLTNYLIHTGFYMLFFYGIGFGMLGVLHLQWMIPIAMLIYFMQAWFSHYWMSKMLYGPIEWLWRQAAYGTPLPWCAHVRTDHNLRKHAWLKQIEYKIYRCYPEQEISEFVTCCNHRK